MRVNIFIDGTWLFKVQAGVLSKRRIKSEQNRPIAIDFTKLSKVILNHVQSNGFPLCSEFGDLHCCTSVLKIPDNFDSWENKKVSDIDKNVKKSDFLIDKTAIRKTRNNCSARENFSNNAIKAGYAENSVLRPILKAWMVERLANKTFQEKQVDTTVVALLVKSAITKSKDIHVVVAGDADIIPAIKIAYPEFSKNVLVVTTHPDELKSEHRQSSYSYQQEEFQIPALYLQDHVKDIMVGNIAECNECRGVFNIDRSKSLEKARFCKDCEATRT